jgi:hypothetical protein
MCSLNRNVNIRHYRDFHPEHECHFTAKM